MANLFQKPSVIAQTALGLLMPDLVLARTVNRDYEKDFVGGVGNVVNVRRPAVLSARTRAYGASGAITLDNVSEPSLQPVTISQQIYSAVGVTDEDANMEIFDFGRQVLSPQTVGMAVAIEQAVVSQIDSLPGSGLTWGTDYLKAFTNARKALRDLGVPAGGMVAAIATDIAADLLSIPQIQKVNESGTDGALRDAQIGRLMGFDIIESNLLPQGTGFFYVPDAFTLVVRAPRVPDGVPFGESTEANGFALRWIKDYDPTVLQDRSILSTFIGTATMNMTKQADGTGHVPAVKVSITGS